LAPTSLSCQSLGTIKLAMKYIIIILFIRGISSCWNKSKNEVNTIVNDSYETMAIPSLYTPFEIDMTDSMCLLEIAKAKMDIEKGKLEYTIHNGLDKRYYFPEEIRELLLLKGITYNPLGVNCTGELNCYGYYMDSVIKTKYGLNFIDSILLTAKQVSVSRWRTKTYKFFQVDSQAYYLNKELERSADNFIRKGMKLPKTWIHTSDKENIRQYAQLAIIIDSNGMATLIKNQTEINVNQKNLKHIKALERQFLERVNSMEPWYPAILNGHKVKYEYWADIYLD
jgi:hypothetical protein